MDRGSTYCNFSNFTVNLFRLNSFYEMYINELK